MTNSNVRNVTWLNSSIFQKLTKPYRRTYGIFDSFDLFVLGGFSKPKRKENKAAGNTLSNPIFPVEKTSHFDFYSSHKSITSLIKKNRNMFLPIFPYFTSYTLSEILCVSQKCGDPGPCPTRPPSNQFGPGLNSLS